MLELDSQGPVALRSSPPETMTGWPCRSPTATAFTGPSSWPVSGCAGSLTLGVTKTGEGRAGVKFWEV